mgnify:CR=1 FL=1
MSLGCIGKRYKLKEKRNFAFIDASNLFYGGEKIWVGNEVNNERHPYRMPFKCSPCSICGFVWRSRQFFLS